MLSRSNTFILIAALLVAVAGGWLQRASHERRAPETSVMRPGEIRPDLVLTDIEGKPHALSGFKARRVLLNFWASWCGPCLDEMPALARTQAKFGEKELIVVGVAMDDPSRVRAFLAEHPVPYPILIGQMEPPSTSLRLGDTGEVLPFSVLLDADGRILATRRGALPAALLADWLR
jgi:thiol-disulfide isomerase/thioredoxin